MHSSSVNGWEAPMAALDMIDGALDTLLGAPTDALTHSELLAVDARLERAVSGVPTVRHRLSPGWPPKPPRPHWAARRGPMCRPIGCGCPSAGRGRADRRRTCPRDRAVTTTPPNEFTHSS